MENNTTWNAAIYIRLSQDDKDKDAVSDSVTNQELYIRNHLTQHPDIHIYDVYIDDGYTGTNFNRPGFKRLMNDIKVNKINCMIVKDLSRLGREYLSVGNYLEHVFPSLGIRFISIMQNIDSYKYPQKMIGLEIPFLSLINEQYAIDISNKTRASLHAKQKAGKFVGVHVPYGYIRDPEDKNRLLVDKTVAKHVKIIFNMFINGYSMSDIAVHFNQQGTLSPLGHFVETGKKKFPKSSNTKTHKIWTSGNVRTILKNPLYTGDLVQGQTTSYSHKVKKRIPVPKEQWIIIPNTHESLVSQDTYGLVQELLAKNTKPVNTLVNRSMFAGYIKCADCHSIMVRNITTKNDRLYYNYLCSNYKKYGKLKCSSHFINEDVVKAVVLSAIQFQIKAYNDIKLLKHKVSSNELQDNTSKKLKSQYDSIQKKVENIKGLRKEANKDLIDDILDEQEFQYIERRMSKKEKSLTLEQENLTQQINKLDDKSIKSNSTVVAFLTHGEVTRLTRSLVVYLIDEIFIYQDKTIRVKFKFQDHLNKLSSAFEKY